MKLPIYLAIASMVLLAGFLLIRPVIAEMGHRAAPDTAGRASQPVPSGVTTPTPVVGGTTSSATGGPSFGPHKPRPTPADAANASISHLEAVEKWVFDFTNQERVKAGLQPLRADEPDEQDALRDIARGHSDDMLFRGYFEHVDPDGLDQAGRIALQHRRMVARSSGENILAMSGHDPSDARQLATEMMYGKDGWMNSPGHKKNILTPEYTHLGVGVAMQGKEIRATQNFAQVIAYTDQPLPSSVSNGGTINPSASTLLGKKAERYDFWISDQGRKAGDAHPMSDLAVNLVPGTYKLRFYFPGQQPGSYSIYWGPQIEVK